MSDHGLKRWTRPSSYIGAEWPSYFVFLGRHRDSDALSRANFDAALKAIGGEQSRDSDDGEEVLPLVLVVEESHWAVGWVQWIAIHESATDALAKAQAIVEKLDRYPVVDEELWSEYETDEANEVWANCYSPSERVRYIREHRSQFEFNDFTDMRACVRGEYFAGYASELLS